MALSPSSADVEAARRLVGCQYDDGPPCEWQGVVEVQYFNSAGPKARLCREHAAPFRTDDDYAVRDSGRPNRRLR